VLIVDEAHDLHSKTLVGLKRLMEVVADGGGTLAIILAGHPKLRNDLRWPTMEEIGYRSVHFALDGAIEDRQAYFLWLIGACKAKGAGVGSIIDDAAIALLAERLRTPLQIEQHLTLAFEHGFAAAKNPIACVRTDICWLCRHAPRRTELRLGHATMLASGQVANRDGPASSSDDDSTRL
jgi:type II secretory pathway predicted ATPase ExeA